MQKLASALNFTSSGKEAKKPLCRQPLNSAFNHTLGRVLPDEETERAEEVEKTTHPFLFPAREQERPRGKSSTKMDGNSAEQLMHSSIWLVQDLRHYETLVKEEAGKII